LAELVDAVILDVGPLLRAGLLCCLQLLSMLELLLALCGEGEGLGRLLRLQVTDAVAVAPGCCPAEVDAGQPKQQQGRHAKQ
jgi:hypothetical protein